MSKRLGQTKKPLNTVQENLTEEDIRVLLEEYEEITDYDELKIGMHIRYFLQVTKKGITEKMFRMGGTIKKIDDDKRYIVLTNGRVSWSVQLNDKTIIYRRMMTDEIKQFYEHELDKKDSLIHKYANQNNKLKEAVKEILLKKEHYKSELQKMKTLVKKAGII